MLIDVGERVKIETAKNEHNSVFYYRGEIARVDDHGVRLTDVSIASYFDATEDNWLNVASDQVLTWKAIVRISVNG